MTLVPIFMAVRLVHGYNRLDVTPGNHFASVNNNPRKDPMLWPTPSSAVNLWSQPWLAEFWQVPCPPLPIAG
jgi:hypothetical protein